MITARNNDLQQPNGEPYSPMTGRHQMLLDNQQCSTSNLSRSSAISVCSSGNLSSSANTNGSKCMITVILPGCNKNARNSIELVVDLKSRVENVLSQVAVLVGLVDVEFFSLAVKTSMPEDEFRFLDADAKMQSVIPREIIKGMRRTASGFFRKQPPSHFADQSAMTLYLRVVCYVDNPALIRDCVALQLYFDQLRENALEYGQLIVPESCFTLAALALQADQQPLPYSSFFESKPQTPDEVISTNPNQPIPKDVLGLYIPDWVITEQGFAFCSMQLPRLQQELSEMSRVEAQLMYCRYASQRPFHHNCHMYGIKRKKTDVYHTLWLGIGFRGLDIFEDVEGRFKKLIGTFDWASIAKIQTNGKCIDMRVVGGKHKYTYWTDTEERAANLLRLIRLAHQLQLQLTRTTDSRLQVTPAFRQDFPTLRRVLHVPQQENTSTIIPVKCNAKDPLPNQKSESADNSKLAKQSSIPSTPGSWAPSLLDESKEKYEPSPRRKKQLEQSENSGNFDNPAFSDSPVLKTKAISLDMLSVSLQQKAVIQDEGTPGKYRSTTNGVVSNSESHLYANSIQPVRL